VRSSTGTAGKPELKGDSLHRYAAAHLAQLLLFTKQVLPVFQELPFIYPAQFGEPMVKPVFAASMSATRAQYIFQRIGIVVSEDARPARISSCTNALFVLLSTALLITGLAATEPVHAAPEFIVTPDSDPLNLPFSDAVIIDNLMIMSGQLGVDTKTFTLVPGGIEAETRQIFANMQAMLAARHASLADLVKCTVMIADISQWPAFNTLYLSYFPDTRPARSALGANGLALGAAVELECWAHLGS